MRRGILFLVGMIAVAGFATAGTSWANKMHGEKARVKLSAVPSVKTSAGGEAIFLLSKDGKSVHYKLDLKKIENVTMAHVHAVGADGTPAAILAWIYPEKGEAPALRKGKFSGKIAEGDLTAANLAGPLKGKEVKELFEQVEHGSAGVAVHTEKNGGGELWGVAKASKKEMKEESSGGTGGY